jgi:hypothetical protein
MSTLAGASGSATNVRPATPYRIPSPCPLHSSIRSGRAARRRFSATAGGLHVSHFTHIPSRAASSSRSPRPVRYYKPRFSNTTAFDCFETIKYQGRTFRSRLSYDSNCLKVRTRSPTAPAQTAGGPATTRPGGILKRFTKLTSQALVSDKAQFLYPRVDPFQQLAAPASLPLCPIIAASLQFPRCSSSAPRLTPPVQAQRQPRLPPPPRLLALSTKRQTWMTPRSRLHSKLLRTRCPLRSRTQASRLGSRLLARSPQNLPKLKF